MRSGPGNPRAMVERGGAPLTLIVAPAGFGKSTLIDVWRQGPEPSVVGSFDAFYRTNAVDVAVGLVDCASALGVSEAECKEALGLIPADGESLGREFVHRLGQSLRALPEPFTCFLDDLQGVGDETARDLGRLLTFVADGRHRFVVTARVAPPWPIERWRVSGFAEVIDADRLRLSGEDIALLFGPEFAYLAPRVREVTEGWPAAVEVIRWRLRADHEPDLADAVLDLVDYVVAEVLPALPDAEMRVLTRTSILPPFPASVAVAVSGEVAAPRILDDVRRRTSLVTRLDDGRFQYHSILRAALRQRMMHTEPALELELQVRAADAWLDEPDSFRTLANAIDHLVEGRAWERVVELLRRHVSRIDRASRLDRFVRWLDLTPGSRWRDDSEMLLLYSWANLRIGKASQALEELRSPVIMLNPETAAVADLTYAWMTGWSTDPREALLLCAQARPVLTGLDQAAGQRRIPRFPGVRRYELAADIAIAQSDMLLGRYGGAAEELPLLLLHRADIAPMPQSTLCGALAFALAMQGEITAAAERAREALQIAADSGAVEGHVRTVPALLAQAVVAQAVGDEAVALARLEEAAARCRPSRAANLLAMCGMVASMCGVSHSYLADLDPPAIPAQLPLVDQFTVAAAARALSRLGDRVGAEKQLRAIEPNEFTLGAWVEVLLHRVERRRTARWVATRSSPTCVRGEIVRLLANAATAESDTEAVQIAGEAADLATREHLIGILMDAPAQLWQRLDAGQSAQPLLIETMSRLRAAESADQIPHFTARELEIVRLLPHVASAEELASRLFVSVNTAKWHRTNIYRKLGVHRRSDAVSRSIELGLIPPDVSDEQRTWATAWDAGVSMSSGVGQRAPEAETRRPGP